MIIKKIRLRTMNWSKISNSSSYFHASIWCAMTASSYSRVSWSLTSVLPVVFPSNFTMSWHPKLSHSLRLLNRTSLFLARKLCGCSSTQLATILSANWCSRRETVAFLIKMNSLQTALIIPTSLKSSRNCFIWRSRLIQTSSRGESKRDKVPTEIASI